MAQATVVLPTLNRESFLLTVLSDLSLQTFKNFEIVIVDQTSLPSQKVQQLVAQNSNWMRYYHVSFRGLPRARNYGFQQAQSDIIIYLDDDVRCAPELVAQHIIGFSDLKVGVVAGGIDEAHRPEERHPVRTGVFNFWTATPTRGFQSREKRQIQHAPGGNFSVRREVLERVHGFDEEFCNGTAIYEETDFCLRVASYGYRLIFMPEARVLHLAASTGGCRVPNLQHYLFSLSRNRMMIIRRYLRWYQIPFAVGRLILLNLSYARAQREPSALISGLKGFLNGFGLGGRDPVVSRF